VLRDLLGAIANAPHFDATLEAAIVLLSYLIVEDGPATSEKVGPATINS
jgi:hypothetical protein